MDLTRGTHQTSTREDHEDPFVHEVPGVCGGYPVIRNTRIPVRVIVTFQRQGAEVDELVGMYPHISRERIQGALDYYAAHPARVDEDIERNERAFAEYQAGMWRA